jgi:hypothetical protein
MLKIGDIWTDPCWYKDDDGECQPKHFAILALGGGDITVRLLTSRNYGRPKAPRCDHDDWYASFFLGVIDPSNVHLDKESWLDLKYAADIDDRFFAAQARNGNYQPLGSIPEPLLCDALLCAATAPDTRGSQSKRIYASRHAIGCK